MSTEGRKIGYREITEKQTELILSVNYGLNYARRLFTHKYSSKTEATYNRELNRLKELKWLIKEPIKTKNMKIYSINWNKIINSFIEHLLSKFDYYQAMWKQYSRIAGKIDYRDGMIIKKAKNPDEEKDFKEKTKAIRHIIRELRKSKREEKNTLIPYFEKDVFIIAYDNGFNGRMTELFDQIILGIGKYGSTQREYKVNRLMGRVIFLCYYLYIFEKTKLYNTLGDAFESRIKGKSE